MTQVRSELNIGLLTNAPRLCVDSHEIIAIPLNKKTGIRKNIQREKLKAGSLLTTLS
jgi:hypothetical protein